MAAAEELGRFEGVVPDRPPTPANGARIVSAVVYTELRVRSSRHHEARAASSASLTPACSRMNDTSLASWVSTHRTTSAMERRSCAAAKNNGASSLAAVAYQNSPSAVVPSALAVSARSAAMRRASAQSRQGVSGDHVLGRAPVDPVGSMHQTRPRALRWRRVSRKRSLFTLAATTGPSHARIAGHGQCGRLPALRRSDDDDRLGPLGRHQGRMEAAMHGARGQAARVGHRRSSSSGAQVVAIGPAGAPGRPPSATVGARRMAGRRGGEERPAECEGRTARECRHRVTRAPMAAVGVHQHALHRGSAGAGPGTSPGPPSTGRPLAAVGAGARLSVDDSDNRSEATRQLPR